MEEKLVHVALDEIRVSPFQPRKEITEAELEELASSIKTVGLIHPPVVRAISQGGKHLYYELIAGERRWRAAARAGLQKITAIVRPSSDEEAAKAALIENLQRVDLNPLEMAESFLKLIEVFRMTQEELAEKVGKKRSTVANYLRLLALPPSIRQSLAQGTITMGHAKAILSLDSAELKEKLHALIVHQELNVRETEKQSQKMGRSLLKKNKQPTAASIHISHLEQKLEEHFGTKVGIEFSKNKSGKVVFSYYSLDDLDRLFQLFGVASQTV